MQRRRGGIAEAVRCGTALVGDISNTLVTFEPLTRSPLAAVVFYELIRFNAPDPDGCRRRRRVASSTRWSRPIACARASPRTRRIRWRRWCFARSGAPMDRDPFAPCSVHLSESPDEVRVHSHAAAAPGGRSSRTSARGIRRGSPPGGSPVQFLDESGFLDARVLAVHGVQMTASDLARLAARGATLVTCPRSNCHTGAGAPPIADFYASGVRVAVGTDSLASTPDLNVFAELAAMRALAPSVPASRLLDSATRQGARALGFDADYGTIEPGKRARLLAVVDSGRRRRCGRIPGVGYPAGADPVAGY